MTYIKIIYSYLAVRSLRFPQRRLFTTRSSKIYIYIYTFTYKSANLRVIYDLRIYTNTRSERGSE